MKNELLEKALWYAKEKQWYVFPCREKPFEYINAKGEPDIAKVKSPYTKNGFNNATLDEKQIVAWWTKYPEAGIGISCGQSNLIVIDIDVRDGKNGFANFMKLGISDDGALHSITPSGGNHIIFKGSMYSQANVKSGVDIRSIGAYIVAPPSFIYEDGVKKYYLAVDDWNENPSDAPSSLQENLLLLRHTGEKKAHKHIDETLETTIEKAQKALDSLPQEYCEDYFMWVNVGMCLHELGNKGLDMWVDWSRKSAKFELESCIKRWEKFEPRTITINTLFFYAKEAKNNG
jgi:hypothetical protein